MSITAWLAKAGKYKIEQIGGIPHFNLATDLAGPRTGIIHTTEKGKGASDEAGWNGALSVFLSAQAHLDPYL